MMNGKFLTKLVYEDLDGSTWKLVEPLVYETAAGTHITVPVGFESDLASIPRLFHRVFPKSGLHNFAAIVHDYLYASQITTKDYADEIFYRGMLARGVGKVRAWLMYQAVAKCGFIAWNQHAKRKPLKTPISRSATQELSDDY